METGLLAAAFIGNDNDGQIYFAPISPNVDGNDYKWLDVKGSNTGIETNLDDLNDEGSQHIAIKYFQGKFYLGFKSPNPKHDLIIQSSPDGQKWDKCATIPEKKDVVTAIKGMVVFKNKLWLAVRTRFDRLVLYSSEDGLNWIRGNETENPVGIDSLGIAVFRDRLWVAISHFPQGVISPSPRKINILSTTDGQTWTEQGTVGSETTTRGISLAAYDKKLHLAFVASNSTNRILATNSEDGQRWSTLVEVGQESTSSAPSLMSTAKYGLTLIFQSNDNGRRLRACQSRDGYSWSTSTCLGNESCKMAPVLTSTIAEQVNSAKLPYFVLGLAYAPPGTTNGSKSYVQYGNASSLSSKITIGKSFSDEATLSSSVGPKSLTVGAEFSLSQSSDTKDAVEIKKTESMTYTINAPSIDGIDHGEDVFFLWINPSITVIREESGLTIWEMGTESNLPMEIQWVTVKQLQGYSPLPAAVVAAKLTDEDKKNILALNPFSQGANAIDSQRFIRQKMTIPYEIQSGLSGGVIAKLERSDVTSSSHAETDSEGETFKFSEASELTGLKVSNTIKISRSMATESGQSVSQSASCSINGPSSAYSGNTIVYVYWDILFSVFMFEIRPLSTLG